MRKRLSKGYILIFLLWLLNLLIIKFAERLPLYAVIFIETALLLIALAGFYAVETACAEVIRRKKGPGEDTANLQRFQNQLNRLTLHCEEEQIKKRLCILAEEMRFCNPTSPESVHETEDEIEALLTEIEEAALSEDTDTAVALCDRITGLLKERDRICKTRR